MEFHNSPSHRLIGDTLTGSKAGQLWQVREKVHRPNDGTGGTFSVGYIATNQSEDEHFLKATDIGLLRFNNEMTKLEQMTEALNLQQFEREMLDICTISGMNRIVRAVDYGEKEVIHEGVKEFVFFIVFEKAKSDIRESARSNRGNGISWIPQVTHNLAVATSQLHEKNISHNDIKPSNLLVFDATLQKLSDLGRATCVDRQGPWDGFPVAGDSSYSAPEAWGYDYRMPMKGHAVNHIYRKRCDLYMLGSLVYFLLTEQPLNTVMRTYLLPEYKFENWSGNFVGVLPYLKNAHGEAMSHMETEIENSYGNDRLKDLAEILQVVRYLTEVDPEFRGDPRNSIAGLQPYDLQRLISRTDVLTKKLILKERS